MNIFVTDPDPVKSAEVLPDKHVVKMPLETCQMLAVVYSKWYFNWGNDLLPKKDGTPYNTEKGAFRGHPCTIWAAQNIYNTAWLIQHGFGLLQEYTHRYGKIHSTESKLGEILQIKPKNIKDNGFVEPPQAMPDYCKVPGDSIKAYQKYYVEEKIGFAKWTKRDIPNWFVAEAYAGFGEPAGYAS